MCYAGTDCKFTEDLYPTESPTPGPSISPTQSPLVYETIENTRFCGSGWEDAQKNCQISRHCPKGRNSECPSGMTCFSWMSGCNIIDMKDYLDNYGVEIYGADRLELNPGSVDSTTNGSGSGSSSVANEWPTVNDDSRPSTGLSPSLTLGVWTPQPAPIERTPPPRWTAAPVVPTSAAPAAAPADGFYPEHHVFCGESWFDAQSRCSEDTFCSDGAVTHVCENENEFCWVGITACDAGDWLLEKETNAPTISTSAPTNKLTSAPIESIADATPAPIESASLNEETASPIESATIDSEVDAPIGIGGVTFPTFTPSISPDDVTNAPVKDQKTSESGTITSNELDRFSIKQSFCAENYIHLIQQCSVLDTCNKSPCKGGLTCFKNVLCSRPANSAPESVATDEAPIERLTPVPSSFSVVESESPVVSLLLTQETEAPATLPPTFSPETQQPSQQPTKFTLSETEIAQRMTNPNNYCAKNLQEILDSCSYALKTCNTDDPMCPLGTNCFGNIICPSPTNAPTTATPVSLPVIVTTLEPIAIDNLPVVNPAARSYCAQNSALVQTTCATAFTCDSGPHTCPFGTSCFSNVVCEDIENQNDSTKLDIEISATIDPIIENNGSDDVVGNYCAESEETIQSTCKEALPCNGGFGTCPFGTFCFSNVVCKALQVQNKEPNSGQSEDDECKDLCLIPIVSEDCEYILSMGLNILPCTGISTQFEQETGIDAICSGTGKCGTSLDLNNCDINKDLYMRVDASTCLEAGLGPSSVLLSDSSETTTPASPSRLESTEAPTDLEISEATTENSSQLETQPHNPLDDPIVYSWEDPAKNITRENQAEIDSWWIMEEANAASPRIGVVIYAFVGLTLSILY